MQDLEPAGSDLSLVLQNLLTKGFFLSLIYLLLHRCIKNYTAEKHLETVNRHRQNALDTFDAFVDAAEGDRETRDAVLLAATNCIFDANQSGYLSAKNESFREHESNPTRGEDNSLRQNRHRAASSSSVPSRGTGPRATVSGDFRCA